MNKYIVGTVFGLTSVFCLAMGRPLPELDKNLFDTERWQFVEGSGAQISALKGPVEGNFGFLTMRFDGDYTLYFADRAHRCNGEDELSLDNQELPNGGVVVDGQLIEMKGVCRQGFTEYSPTTVVGQKFLNKLLLGNKEIRVGTLNITTKKEMKDYSYIVSAMGFKQASMQALKAKQ